MASIQINDQLLADLQKIVSASQEFKSVDEYVGYILGQVVEKKSRQASSTAPVTQYSKADEDKIRERLKNLGYLD
ncbi:MAG: hypothetical protein WCV88_04220 [Patescibacteria group bacterium]|jgi:hypothetical protein